MTRRRTLVVVLVAMLVLLVAVAWIAVRGMQAQDRLAQVRSGVTALREQALAGDVEAARATLAEVQDHTSHARDLTSDPVWRVASLLPVVGDDLSAVSTISREADRLSSDMLPPLVQSAAVLDPAALQPRDGAIDLAPLREAAPLLQSAATALDAARANVDAIGADGLVAAVANARRDLLGELDRAAAVLEPGAQAARLMPGMLGAEGPRRYLVLFQNNAEVRAGGGIPGAYAVITAQGGRLELAEQGTAGSLGHFSEPVLELPRGVEAMFGQEPATYLADVTMTPDWPLSAELARQMYRQRTGSDVDGVASVDPVALSYLLEATGPVELPDGRDVAADQVVDYLLSDAYRLTDGVDDAAQDAVSAAVAAQAFSALASGAGNPRDTLRALTRGVEEARLMLWSGHEAEQRVLDGTALAGLLRPAGTGGDPARANQDSPVTGVFLNAAMAGKMDFYLRQDVELSAPRCSLGSSVRRDLDVTLTSTAPPDAATALPEYVTGTTRVVPRGSNRTQVVLYGPPGGSFGQLSRDGEQVPFGSSEDAGHPTAMTTVVLTPGQSVTVSAQVLFPSSAQPVVRTTPTVVAADVRTVTGSSAVPVPVCRTD